MLNFGLVPKLQILMIVQQRNIPQKFFKFISHIISE